ncbi:hypothetical protein HK105_205495 [Polyrhizophydium stewartii]|uniref:chitin synthase n=1 Tax=Polyrhizophydium stewartii TaxID=2732419 RepID=A0ABR4N5Y8_9FUNG|nr:Chitin synthase, class 3 [Polyrhizophydium stewartii]
MTFALVSDRMASQDGSRSRAANRDSNMTITRDSHDSGGSGDSAPSQLPSEFSIGPVGGMIVDGAENASVASFVPLKNAVQLRSVRSNLSVTTVQQAQDPPPPPTSDLKVMLRNDGRLNQRRTIGTASQGIGKEGSLALSKPMVHSERSTANVNILAPTPAKAFDPWIIFVYASTCCCPGVLLARMGGMHDAAVQRAWREKVALCWISFLFCVILGFITFGLNYTICQRDTTSVGRDQVLEYKSTTYPHRFIVHGAVYDMSSYYTTHNALPSLAGTTAATMIAASTGIDISNYFPRDISPSCLAALQSEFTIPCSTTDFSVVKCHSSSTATAKLASLRVGSVIYELSDVSNTSNGLMIFRGKVLNITSYISVNSLMFGSQADKILRSHVGKDASLAFAKANLVSVAECLSDMFMVGTVSQLTTGCIASDVVLYVSFVVIGALIIIRFVLAVWFRWVISDRLGRLQKQDRESAERRLSRRVDLDAGRMPFTMQLADGIAIAHRPGAQEATSSQEQRETIRRRNTERNGYGQQLFVKPSSTYGKELHTIMLVTCYSEDEDGLRTTFDSLAMTDYSEDHKVLFIIADGLIKGSGNTQTTPDMILSMLELDRNWGPPEALSYLAIGDGSKVHNMAKVYVAWYQHQDRVVPTILIVKCGTEAEATTAKPGNRGKRDSQMILMRFLQKVTLDEPMTPLEYDLFLKLHYLMGVTPDTFEIVLMVDADTKVAPDSLARMVACMADDPRVMGLCGETRIANKSESWVSRIQVFEYYLSHHLTKAFESMFGGVTCLPGCFCMYRIKAPKDGYWVPILCNPDIVETYSESVVSTLHKKNLLLLGEDRFLTTLMLRAFPRRKLIFVPRAFCKTTVPAEFKVLLSQRRRWINSTIHNLMELILVPNLCGIFCFSMQFVILLELIGTVTLPAAIIFTFTLIIVAIVGPVVPVIPLILLAGILGLPAVLILLTTRKLVYIYWMFVYLCALPVWNFVLPVYAFWHFDDFSWGQTRQVEGEQGRGGGHGESDGVRFDASRIPMRRWVEWERDRRQALLQQQQALRSKRAGDTVAIKQELADALGRNAPLYWTKLRSFMAGHCSKSEFDSVALGLLSAHQARLHNKLIMAIVYNLQAGVPLPSGPPSLDFVAKNSLEASAMAASKRKADHELSPAEIKRRFTANLIMSLSHEDRRRLAGLGMIHKSDAEPLVPSAKAPLFPFGFPAGIDSIPRSCKEESDLPSLDAMQQRLRFISALQGLDEPPSLETSQLMSFALDNYLTNLIQATISTFAPLRRKRAATPAASIAPDRPLGMSPAIRHALPAQADPSRTGMARLARKSSTRSASSKPSRSGSIAPLDVMPASGSTRTAAPGAGASTDGGDGADERPSGLADLAFAFDFQPQTDSDLLERIMLQVHF